MTLANQWFRGIFEALLSPFRSLPPIVGLGVVSLVASVVILLLFRATSNQPKLAAVKRKIHACLFEIRLLRDDAVGILRAQGEMLLHQGAYLKLVLLPLGVMTVLLLPVIAHLQFHYGYRGLLPGQQAVFKVRLKDGWRSRLADGSGRRPVIHLHSPGGITVETAPVWIPSLREMAWRIRASRWGDYLLEVRTAAGETVSKTVRVSRAIGRRSPERLGSGFSNQLLYPAEDPLPENSAIASIAVGYPAGAISLFGWEAHWMIVFFVLSTVFALLLRGPLKVTI